METFLSLYDPLVPMLVVMVTIPLGILVAEEKGPAMGALAGSCVSCVAEVLVAVPLFFLHPGPNWPASQPWSIHPMGWALESGMIALASFGNGIVYFTIAMWRPKRLLAALGLLLSPVPFLLSLGLLRLASWVCGFSLRD